MPTINVELPYDLYVNVHKHVENGTFADDGDMVYEALRQFDERDYKAKLQQLRDALAEGIRQANAGEVVDYDMKAIMDELDREFDS